MLILDKLIEYNANMAMYYDEKSYSFYKLDEFQKAEESLTKGISIMSDSVSLYMRRGWLYQKERRFEKALADHTVALTKTKDSLLLAEIYAYKGASLLMLRDFENAYQTLLQALDYDPNSRTALNNIATICDEAGRPEETLVYLRKLIELDPKLPYAHLNIGFKLQSLGKHKKAIEFFNNAIELDSEAAYAYSNRAFSKLHLGLLEAALIDVNKSLELDELNSYAYKIKALIFIEKKEFKKACKELNIASRLNYTKFYGDEVDDLIKEHCNTNLNKI